MTEKVLHESFAYESHKGCALLLKHVICDLSPMDSPSLEAEICLYSVSHDLPDPGLWCCWGFPFLLNSLLGSFSYLSLPRHMQLSLP